jgi:hypothetical protein
MNISDGRTIHIFNARGAGDIERLASAIAERLALQLFELGGRLYWLGEIGQLTPVSRRLLQNLIGRHFHPQPVHFPLNPGGQVEPAGTISFSSWALLPTISKFRKLMPVMLPPG